MKKKFILYPLLCVILFMISCQKEKSDVSKVNTDQNITKKLLDFKNKLGTKNPDIISPDSARWYIEGVLNYENANNDHKITNLSFNYDTIQYNYSIDALDYSQLETIYIALQKEIDYNLKQVPVSLCDMINLKFLPFDNGINVVLVSTFGSKAPKYLYAQFGSDDYWRWGQNQGKCDGTCVGSDACDQLQTKLNSPLNKPYIVGYYTSIVCVNENYNSHPLPNYQYRMFMASGGGSSVPTPGPCISPDQLNFYISNFDYIKDINCPPGKEFKNVNVTEDYATSDYWSVAHHYKLYYGTFVPGASQQ